MKRIIFYAAALSLGVLMSACGSSGSNNNNQSTCTNQFGQTVNGTMVGNQCVASNGAGNCTPCAGGMIVPALGNACVPQYQAQQYCGAYGNGYYGGYGQGGYGYPGYYGGGYYGGGMCYQTYRGIVCY